MKSLLLVALGGALGSVMRYGFSGLAARWMGESFPWGTFLVNVLGSFLIGIFATLTGGEGRWAVSLEARNFVMVGVLGGFTTFSSFSWQTLQLARNAEWIPAGMNILGTVALCLVFVWLGQVVATRFGP